MAINFKLKQFLAIKKITQLELGNSTGIRQPTISAICNNSIKAIPIGVLEKICDYLDCQPGDFIENITPINVEKRRLIMSRDYNIPITTKEERKKQVSNAIALSTLDAPDPTKETMKFFDQYVNGTITQEEIFQNLRERYNKPNEELIYSVTLKKEVLDEFAAEILADYVRYFIKNDINSDNRDIPIVKDYWNLAYLKEKIIGTEYYNELEGLKEVEKALKDAKKSIAKMED